MASKRKKLVEVECPRCHKTRNTPLDYPKTCPECLEDRDRDRRLDTKRRPTKSSYCLNCIESAQFEYFLIPPRRLRKEGKKGRVRDWCPLCDACFNKWLETGIHREALTYTPNPRSGSKGRPLTQDERDVRDLRRTLNKSTGLFTNDWRRP